MPLPLGLDWKVGLAAQLAVGRAVGSLGRNRQKVDPINRQVSLSVGSVPDGHLRWIQRI